MDGYLLNKNDLAKYLIVKHINNNGALMSPIKLHKGLYLMYAFWGNRMTTEYTKMDTSVYKNQPKKLFDAKFKAYALGPIDEEILDEFTEDKLKDESYCKTLDDGSNLLLVDEKVMEWIEEFSDAIMNTGSFSLVEIAQQSKHWKEKFNNGLLAMDNDIIVNEFNHYN